MKEEDGIGRKGEKYAKWFISLTGNETKPRPNKDDDVHLGSDGSHVEEMEGGMGRQPDSLG